MDESNKTRILNMLKDGQITVEEAEQLLAALDQPEQEPVVLKDSRGRKAKEFRVVVDAIKDEKKSKVNVHIPISLIKTLGPVIIKNMPAEAKAEIDKSGVDLAEIMNSIDMLIQSGQDQDIVNVDVGEGPDMAKVRVYVE